MRIFTSISGTYPMSVFIKIVRFEVFTAVSMLHTVFWDINTSSYLKEDTLLPHYRAHPINAK
jgi:hypothetical protein